MELLQTTTSTPISNVPQKNTKPLNKHSLKAFRIQEAKNNIAFFSAYYFSHYATKPNSELHWYLYKTLPENLALDKGQRVVIAAPRGNAKSSITSLIFPLWCILFKKKKFIILISDTSTQANDFLKNIRDEIENNERLREDFGNLKGDIWKNDDIVTSTGIRVLALGTGKKIRGRRHGNQRPDLIICDDLENDENTQNPDQRKKNENWFFKAVSKAGDETTDIFVVGTIIHYDSLLSHLLSNPIYHSRIFRAIKHYSQSPKWQEWEEIYLRMSEEDKNTNPSSAEQFFIDNKEEMLQGTEVLWPGGQPYYQLMELRLTEGPASFDSEYQNNPINPDDCLFQEEWFRFIEPDWANYTQFIGAVDPSMGKTATSDYSAIIVLAKHKEGYLDVLTADIARRHPDIIIDDIISQTSILIQNHKEIPFSSFAVETVQFQEYFKDKLNDASRQKGVYLPVSQVENQTSKKEIRIQTLQPLIKNGIVRFQKSQRLLLEQLKYYPLADHDDGPDALEMAVRKARTPQLVSKKY